MGNINFHTIPQKKRILEDSKSGFGKGGFEKILNPIFLKDFYLKKIFFTLFNI